MEERTKDHRNQDPPAPRSHGTDPRYLSSSRAYLLTLHYPSDAESGTGDPAFVTVQASRSNESHRFADLAAAFRYLDVVSRRERRRAGSSGS